jgi:hypothetical protein
MNSFDPFVENCSNYCIVTPSLWPSNVANSRLKVILAPKGGDEILKRDTVGKQIPRALTTRGLASRNLPFVDSLFLSFIQL